MSMDLDSSLHGVTRPPPEICEESEKRLKSELDTVLHNVTQPPSESCEEEREMQVKPESDSDSDSGSDLVSYILDREWESKPIEYLEEKYDKDPIPRVFGCSRFLYRNPAQRKIDQDIQDAVAEYQKTVRNLSPYDAIDIPPFISKNCYHNWPSPVPITAKNKDRFIDFSKLAVAYYNSQRQDAKEYEFVNLVKVTDKHSPLRTYFITFQAKAKEYVDPSNCPITTFQAQVWNKFTADGGSPEVVHCSIKPNN